MEPTPKIFETGAMKMEYGLDTVNQSDGWGGDTGYQELGANDAFPWLSFSNKLNVTTEEDASVTTRAFKTTPRMIGKTIDNPVSYYARFKGLNRFHYWMWGFENEVAEVVVCRAGTSPFSSAPTPGDTCVDGSANNFIFLRTEVTRAENLYIFRAVDSLAPVGLTLTNVGWTFTLTSTSAVLYEHIYELDSYGRRYRLYSSAEQSLLSLSATDKRNLMATFGKRTSNYDLRYKNAMCKNFSMKMSAAGLAMWDANYMAFTEERSSAADGYDSSTWSLLAGLQDGSLVPAHFEYRFYLGIAEAMSFGNDGEVTGLDTLCMSDISFDVEVPLQSLQDTCSGLSLAEPVLEAKYGAKCTGTISRHTSSTYQGYRDNQNKVAAHIIANQGDYMQEILIKEATLSEAGGDDSDVMAEPLALELGYVEGSNAWTTYMNGVTELHDSPAVYRVRDDSAVNQMTLL